MMNDATNEDEDFQYLDSNLSESAMYQGVSDDALIEASDDDTQHPPDTRIRLYWYDHFVRVVLKAKEPRFTWSRRKGGGQKFDSTPVTRAFYALIFESIDLPVDIVRYSENVELFLSCHRQLSLPLPFKLPPDACLTAYGNIGRPSDPLVTRCGHVFNRLVDLVIEGASQDAFKRRVRERKRSADSNYQAGINYAASLFAKTSRLLVLRIDLGYRLTTAKTVTAAQIHGDLSRLINNRRHNGLFECQVGYMWKLEDGEDRGLHVHVILFYDGSRVHKHAYLAEQIGQYWVETITKGQGTYYSCHRHPSRYRRSGIGMIHHTDTEKLDTLNVIVKYITKKEQYLHVKDGRTFGRGIAAIASTATKLGRPRTKQLQSGLTLAPEVELAPSPTEPISSNV